MGSLTPATSPRRKNSATHAHGLVTPAVHARTMSAEATAEKELATKSTRRRSRLSEMYPARGLTSSIGMNEANPAMPIQPAEPVIWNIT